ncbi:hypothetical protein Pmani_034705 [Petrolisthes manimaculis]|uniref:Uncharacterized protein n=1 Tax=Petrolisthes manimaculis TaxID=1843537 RepID=A0AAE1NNS9_9EUCA|nr:hypothetical protein Pmani_034705 [Petrolisthes manimaculis]
MWKERYMLEIDLPGRRKKGRPKRRFMDAVNKDMRVVRVIEEDVDDKLGKVDMAMVDPLWRPKDEDVKISSSISYLATLTEAATTSSFPQGIVS